MDNEKLNNEETKETEATEEVAEETAEGVDVVEETAAEGSVETETEASVEENAAEESSDATDENKTVIVEKWQCTKCETINDTEVCAVCGEPCEKVEIEESASEDFDTKANYLETKSGLSKGSRIGIIAGAVVVVAVLVAAALWYFGVINPYEKGYVDVSGVTLEELADKSGYSVSEYKKMNDLPWLMPKSTNENAVKNNITVKVSIAQSGMTFDDFKKYYGWGDNITEESTVGEALGETKLSVILGTKDMEEDEAKQTLDSFKEFYGFGDDVTFDTLYKDVRIAIDKKTRESRLEQEKEAEQADKDGEAAVDKKDAETGADAEAEDSAAEAPAEDKAAEAPAEDKAAE